MRSKKQISKYVSAVLSIYLIMFAMPITILGVNTVDTPYEDNIIILSKNNVCEEKCTKIIPHKISGKSAIIIESGTHWIEISNINIISKNSSAVDIKPYATVNLNLVGKNKIMSFNEFAALHVPINAVLNLYGTGELTATGSDGAGIGGNYTHSGVTGDTSGKININSGTINAESHESAAIGGGAGYNSNGGDSGRIVINGGTVKAIGLFSAGIGGGSGRFHTGKADVTINGGNVVAESVKGAGIGGGYGGNIIIGGTETKVFSQSIYGAGIGGCDGMFRGCNGGNITIGGTGIQVFAKSISGAGIGGGAGNTTGGNGGNVTITGGNVTVSSENAMDIGGGSGSGNSTGISCDTLEISPNANVNKLTNIATDVPVTKDNTTSLIIGIYVILLGIGIHIISNRLKNA